MKILITTDWYKPVINGVVTSIINLEDELRRQGHEVKILTLSSTLTSYRDGDVTYIGSLSAGKIYPNARIRVLCNQKWIREMILWRPDIVHSQCEFSSFGLAKKISESLHIPLIHTYHTIYEDYTHYFSANQKMGQKAAGLFSRMICNQTDGVVVPTEKVRHLLGKYGVQVPIWVSPSGIDLNDFQKPGSKSELRKELQIQEDVPVLLFLGRLAKEKNVEELLEYLRDYRGEKLTFLIVGDGPDRMELEELAKGVSSNIDVIFTGMVPRSETWKYYRAADLFVSASQSETQGLTYVEACAAGLILLCKEDDCLKSVLKQNKNGWQFDSKEAFHEALMRYRELDHDGKMQMSEQSKLIGDAYSIEHTSERIKSIYLDVLKEVPA